MSRTTRHSKRKHNKAARRAKRKAVKQRAKTGQKAGSIAIHSCLPGLEGTELGAMDVVVDTRRKENHPALITVAVHNSQQQRALVWSIETGFGGQPPRVGYQEVQDGALDQIAPTQWIFDHAGEPSQTKATAANSATQPSTNPGPTR